MGYQVVCSATNGYLVLEVWLDVARRPAILKFERRQRVKDLDVDLEVVDFDSLDVLRNYFDFVSFELGREGRSLLGLIRVCLLLGLKFVGGAYQRRLFELCNLVSHLDKEVPPGKQWVGQILRTDGFRLGEVGISPYEIQVCKKVVSLDLIFSLPYLTDFLNNYCCFVESVLNNEVVGKQQRVFG
jgi:hypothetical protein